VIRIAGQGEIIAFNMQASGHFFTHGRIANRVKDLPRRNRNT
jgi:hypothetical protein